MTAVAAMDRIVSVDTTRARVDLLDCFIARTDARALLWHAGVFGLAEAVDVLQRDAERDGLVKRIGQDAVQEIIADAFAPFWEAAA